MDKRLKYCLYLITAASGLFFSCKRDTGNGNILCTVKIHGHPLPEAHVYIKAGITQIPKALVPPSDFDRSANTDAYGQAYFDDLPPQHYYLLVKGYDPNSKKGFSKDTLITIQQRFRDNEYDLTIDIAWQY